MNYSPKLKKAMAEIREILDKHDIAGFVALHTPGYGEHMLKIDPSYSAAKYVTIPEEENQIGISVRIKTDEVGKEKARDLATYTTNMFHVLTEITGPTAMKLIEMSEYMDDHYNSDHDGPGHEGNNTQNN